MKARAGHECQNLHFCRERDQIQDLLRKASLDSYSGVISR